MRKHFSDKLWAAIQPVYILSVYDENGGVNALVTSCGSIYHQNSVCVKICNEHTFAEDLLKKGYFSMNLVDAAHVYECDLITGSKDHDSLAKSGLHVLKEENVPIIEELPVSFVCKLTDYNQESGILTADVLDISVDERCLSDGEVDLSKIDPITNNPFTEEYVRIGEVVGNALKK